MSKVVPYLADEVIERDAVAMLSEFAQARGLIIEPPIPIEDIVEKHLKLGIEFDDTHRLSLCCIPRHRRLVQGRIFPPGFGALPRIMGLGERQREYLRWQRKHLFIAAEA